jgi:hypothetical protein
VELPIPAELHTPALVDLCFAHFRKMLPLHQWLLAITGQT